MEVDSNRIYNTETFITLKDVVICCICTGILYDPQQCSVCENNFCLKCISIWRKSRNCCPMKCENSVIKESSKLVKKMLNKLQFSCNNNCNMIIAYHELYNHYNSDCPEILMNCSECGEDSKKIAFLYGKTNKLKDLEKNFTILKKKLKDLQKMNELLIEENIYLKELSGENSGDQSKLISIESKREEQCSLNYNFLRQDNEISFEYKIFQNACNHYKFHNFVCIFECCNQAFPCFICHDTESNHSFTNVMKGYCNRCLCIFTWENTFYCPNCGLQKQNRQG